MNINEILQDLYRIDPSLRNEEAELKKLIDELIKSRPDAEPDAEFKARLKSELISKMEEKDRKKVPFLIMHRKAFVGAAGLAAALVLVLTFAVRPEISRVLRGAGAAESAEVRTTEQERDYAVETKNALRKEEAANKLAKQLSAPAAEMKRMNAPMGLAIADEEISADFFDDSISSAAAPEDFNTEEYSRIYENAFYSPAEQPLSTFSIDVDTASYSNVRRFLNNGSMPYPDSVRIEELINYFDYDYPQPEGSEPFSLNTELAACPWNEDNLLLMVGLQGKTVEFEKIPESNIVFLIDSSGSMQDENKLPLLKQAMAMLTDQLRPEDRVSIVAYAGSAGLVLPPVSGNDKDAIFEAIDNLDAGGSTAGGEGIELAYSVATENLFKNGNNRIILATDGDFNVGASSEGELIRLIESKRDQGIYLTVLGFGMGNYKDSRMESLADKGNGNYAYIDTLNEARKVLVEGLSGTMFTIASDVKIQIEFNPAYVGEYRLIGYENRVMAAQDFDDDKKDAGEIGAGHSVTALYEIKPAEGALTSTLRYQTSTTADGAEDNGELGYLKFRYKNPGETESLLTEKVISSRPAEKLSENLMFASAVAEWGMMLRQSEYAPEASIEHVIGAVKKSLGEDPYGYRAEFLTLLYKTRALMAASEH